MRACEQEISELNPSLVADERTQPNSLDDFPRCRTCRFDCHLLFARRNRRVCNHFQRQRLVYGNQQAFVESARLDFWAGVVNALSDDGRFGLAGVEKLWIRKIENCDWMVRISSAAQLAVVSVVLWPPTTWLGAGGNRGLVGFDLDFNFAFL